ncbi:lysine 6-monooxygenase, partial [Streptomyces tricolor]
MTGVPAPRARVAVLGAGPKAAALAAKTHVLNELGLADVELSVFERDEIGAHWTGRAGWTSGSERLGTRAEKDVGFPYRSTYRFGAHGKEIDARMQAFSWQSHLIDTGSYQQWIDAGLPSPTHR